MIDVERTVISQYGNSATISRLIQNMNVYLDPRSDFDAFYDFVWNVDTAKGFGLDIWGRIVNVSRELRIEDDGQYFGFIEASPGSFPFDDQPFYDETQSATSTHSLSNDAYRKLILVKALSNISNTTAPAMNRLLQNLFEGRGRCYVNDTGNMTMRYTFEFALTKYEIAILTQSGALLRPAGVKAEIFATILPVFGFSEAGIESAAPFGQAPFISEGTTHAAD